MVRTAGQYCSSFFQKIKDAFVYYFEVEKQGTFPDAFLSKWKLFKTGLKKADAEARQNGEKKADEGKVDDFTHLPTCPMHMYSHHVFSAFLWHLFLLVLPFTRAFELLNPNTTTTIPILILSTTLFYNFVYNFVYNL